MTENQGHNTCSPQSEVLASIQTALRNTTSEVKALKAIDENIGKINKLAEETKALLKNNKTIFENTQHSNYLHYLLLMLTESVFHFNETYFNNADINKRNEKECFFSLIAICNLQKDKIAKQKYPEKWESHDLEDIADDVWTDENEAKRFAFIEGIMLGLSVGKRY